MEADKEIIFEATINVDRAFCEDQKTSKIKFKLEGSSAEFETNIACAKCANCKDFKQAAEVCSNKGNLTCGGCQCQ